jgi:N-acetylneuraminate synthase
MHAKRSITIAGRRIGTDAPPYVIAELSANHNGNLATATRIVEQAAAAGADAVKLQTYRADTITIDCDAEEFMIRGGLWDGRTLYSLYEQAHLPWEWHAPLFEHAHNVGITIFSSPFDITAVDLLERLGAPAYKIASFELIDLPLIRYVASTGKPMIMSTGMADKTEIEEALEAARQGGAKEVALLHCVSGYPAPAEDYNLRTIPDMISRFDVVTGLSDHTLGNATAVASIAMGAAIIEKHFTLDRNGGGPDDSFSLEPPELAALCADVRTAWEALGRVDYGRKPSEQGNTRFRRSLYFVVDMKAGERVTRESIRSIRPGFGVPPKFFDQCIGRQVRTDVRRGTPVSWALLE